MSKLKKTGFHGCDRYRYPFKNGKVDYDAFGKLIDFRIACGTTHCRRRNHGRGGDSNSRGALRMRQIYR